MLKKYSPRRYGGEKLEAVAASLRRSASIRGMGVPCPRLYEYGGALIQTLENGTSYLLMDYIEGRRLGAESVSLSQMEALGETCGRMHEALSTLSPKGTPVEPKLTVQSLWEGFESRLLEAEQSGCPDYLEAVKL